MKTSIATVSISGTFADKLDAIAAAGFDGIEIFEQDFIAFDGTPRDVGNMVRDRGLEITLFQPFRDFEGLPEPLRTKAFDRARRKFDLMRELGADTILVCSSCHPAALGGIDRAATDFHQLGEIASGYGIRVGYEALAWGRYVNDHRDAWEIVRRADHPNVGLILDSLHTLGAKIDPETIRRIPGDRIFFVQLADAPAIDMDLLYWSRHFRNMPGEGDLQVVDFMRSVMATGYAGPISLEIFNDQFRGSSTRGVARDGFCSLVALMDDVQRAEPSLQIDSALLPARQCPANVEFVEIAARGEDARRARHLLATLGFQETGRHRAKEAALFQQGEVRLIVNEAPVAISAGGSQGHGAAVCDIGFFVADGAAVLSRARSLGALPCTQDSEATKPGMPAVRGLAGGALHFIDDYTANTDRWARDYGASQQISGAGLTRIDHLAHTMSYEDMMSWTLFYTSLFDMEKSPMVDVIDPDGLVRSQVVQSPDGGVRITLNGADTHRTLAGSFLVDQPGASVQHIAFATDDIFSTLAVLEGSNFTPLLLSPNYYDDLAARFDISEDLLQRMKSHNILYDHDGGGAFFQVFSRDRLGGMFFEIVQRDPGYQGFGGPNAPFRIAAQKRAARASSD